MMSNSRESLRKNFRTLPSANLVGFLQRHLYSDLTTKRSSLPVKEIRYQTAARYYPSMRS